MQVKNSQFIIIIKEVFILIGIISVACLVILNNPKSFILGLVFGGITSVLNFRLLYLTLSRAVHMLPHNAERYAASNYLVRYVITGIVLFVAVRANHINVYGVVTGLFLLKLVILRNELLNKKLIKDILKRKEEEV
ncbi:ATP synthase subunit I [Alkaliphilus hydrothermalis]|uniref:ATP synthase I chain n=1 Tax=Alkaliphilus hydrothermalis TaxID=1482730 RepID=A0ABS2NQA2_9FIRM|nr:hypothetical protein [Alkaliphilus hydrothermalis]